MSEAALVVLAYLVGSLSPSVHLGRVLTGKDVREHGSGNPGTTNTFRVLGTRMGVLVLVLDVVKGFAPVFVARQLAGPEVAVAAAVAALAGHNYSLFLRGRGGKGVATGAGTVLALTPLILAVQLAVFGLVLAATAYVSLASLSAVVLYPVLVIGTGQPFAYMAFSLVGAGLVIWAHRGNIRRLLQGTERKANLPWRRRKTGPGNAI
ncbi:MAG: glycerol-3-phosphate 1-O-acyltransferase PlsY [Thermoleophilia bacterium]